MVKVNKLLHTGLASDDPMSYISNLSEISQSGTQRAYWVLRSDQDSYYIFESERAAVTEVLVNLDTTTRREKIRNGLLSLGRRNPIINYIIPSISKVNIDVPESFNFNVGFISHKANFVKKNEAVLVMGPREALYRDIRASFMRPNSVDAPRILRSNVQEGYYIKDYRFGRRPDVENFSAILLAYDQLNEMYETNRKDSLSTDEVLSDLCRRVSSQSCFSEDEIRSSVQPHEFPNILNKSFIHGDLSFRNLLFKQWDDTVSIIDWSWSRNDFVFADTYLPFHIYSNRTNRKNIFAQMVSKEGRFHSLHQDSVKKVGTQMYDANKLYTGMPILYLLYAIDTYSDPEMVASSERLLRECIEIET